MKITKSKFVSVDSGVYEQIYKINRNLFLFKRIQIGNKLLKTNEII